MPKITWNIPQEQRALVEELRGRYGGMMSRSDVMAEIGCSSARSTDMWLAGLPYVQVNKRKKWRVDAIAKHIYENTVRG